MLVAVLVTVPDHNMSTSQRQKSQQVCSPVPRCSPPPTTAYGDTTANGTCGARKSMPYYVHHRWTVAATTLDLKLSCFVGMLGMLRCSSAKTVVLCAAPANQSPTVRRRTSTNTWDTPQAHPQMNTTRKFTTRQHRKPCFSTTKRADRHLPC